MSKWDKLEKNHENQKDTKKNPWQTLQEASADADLDVDADADFDGESDGDAALRPATAKATASAGATADDDLLELTPPSISNLEKELLDAEQRATTYWNDKMRLAAEMQNLTRRHEQDLKNRSQYANAQFAESLLSVLDSCVAGVKIDPSQSNAKAMHEGLELIYKQLMSVFEKFQLQEIDPLGQAFNPKYHQAMLAQVSDAPEGTVIEVIQKGFQLHDRVLRPARVIVAKKAE